MPGNKGHIVLREKFNSETVTATIFLYLEKPVPNKPTPFIQINLIAEKPYENWLLNGLWVQNVMPVNASVAQ